MTYTENWKMKYSKYINVYLYVVYINLNIIKPIISCILIFIKELIRWIFYFLWFVLQCLHLLTTFLIPLWCQLYPHQLLMFFQTPSIHSQYGRQHRHTYKINRYPLYLFKNIWIPAMASARCPWDTLIQISTGLRLQCIIAVVITTVAFLWVHMPIKRKIYRTANNNSSNDNWLNGLMNWKI